MSFFLLTVKINFAVATVNLRFLKNLEKGFYRWQLDQNPTRQGFQTIAKSGTPWTEQEKEKLNTALKALANLKEFEDPTISGDFKKVERWLSWAVLGGSRCEGAVRRRLDVVTACQGCVDVNRY